MSCKILLVALVSVCILSCDLDRIPDFFNEQRVPTFRQTVGGSRNEFPHAVLPSADGLSFIIVGNTQSYTPLQDNDAYILRIDTAGNAIDFGHYGNLADDVAYDVEQTAEGGFLMVGATQDPASLNQDVYVVKVNSTLDTPAIQSFIYGSQDSVERAFGIEPIGNNNFIVAYSTHHVNGGDESVRFLRVNGNGSKLSDKAGVSGNFYLNDLIVTSDNKIVVVGSDYESETAALIIKFDEDGDYVWDEKFPEVDPNYSPGYAVMELDDKSLVIAGSRQVSGDHEFMIVRFSETGEKTMDRNWGGSNDDELLAVTKSADNKIVVLGYSNSLGPQQIFLSKREPSDGAEIWKHYYNGPAATFSYDVKLCPDKGFIIVAGQNATNADIITIKTDADGNAPN